jgi:hypothetical protein
LILLFDSRLSGVFALFPFTFLIFPFFADGENVPSVVAEAEVPVRLKPLNV